MSVIVRPHSLRGTVQAPPSKSYAHRYLIAAYLSGRPCTIVGAGDSRDIRATLDALGALGLRYRREGDDVAVLGVEHPNKATVYCHESGSTLRFLLPVAAALGIPSAFTAAAGLMARPVEGLVTALNAHGAAIDGLRVSGRLTAGEYVVDGTVSSQYITGLLFALPLLDGDSRVVVSGGMVSKAYVDVTLDVLSVAGVSVEKTAYGFSVRGRQTYRLPDAVNVEGDWSAAAFMLAAGALGGPVTVANLDPCSLQGDAAILSVLDRLGAHVRVSDRAVTVSRGALRAFSVDVDEIPDLAQIIAVLAAYAEGDSILSGVERLRLKESDRLAAITDMLAASGVRCRLVGRTLVVTGGTPAGGAFEGGGDHRTVMSACILAAYAAGDSRVSTPSAVGKSYPDFFKDFSILGGQTDGDIQG